MLCWESTVSIYGLVVRSSYRELQDSTRRTFQEWFGPIMEYREGNEQAVITFAGRDGVTRAHYLDFRACKREAEASKFMSTEYAFIWLEEVVPAFTSSKSGGVMGQGLPKGVLDTARLRIRQKGAPRLEILLTFNPPSTRHWTYKEFYQQTPEDMERKSLALFKQPPGENKANLPTNYYEDLLENLTPELARRWVGGEVTTVYEGERVFPECQDGIHIVDYLEPIPHVPLTLGQDYGLSPCCAITQILPGGQTLIIGELQLFNKGMKAFIEHLGPFLQQEYKDLPVRKIWQDPNGGNQRAQVDETLTCATLLRNAGFDVSDGDNNWTLRREVTKQRFEWFPGGRPGVVISRQHCPMIVEGFLGGYRYPMTAAGIPGSSPIKNEFSHLQDALQMIFVGEFSMLSGLLLSSERTARKEIRARGYNPLSSNGEKTFSRYSWMRR